MNCLHILRRYHLGDGLWPWEVCILLPCLSAKRDFPLTLSAVNLWKLLHCLWAWCRVYFFGVESHQRSRIWHKLKKPWQIKRIENNFVLWYRFLFGSLGLMSWSVKVERIAVQRFKEIHHAKSNDWSKIKLLCSLICVSVCFALFFCLYFSFKQKSRHAFVDCKPERIFIFL